MRESIFNVLFVIITVVVVLSAYMYLANVRKQQYHQSQFLVCMRTAADVYRVPIEGCCREYPKAVVCTMKKEKNQ